MNKKYPFELEKLPYKYDALEPIIDKQTVEIHHDKHHQTYVDNLNKLLADKPELQDKSLEELMNSEVIAIKNNAGGVWNHNFYWGEMTSPDNGHIADKLLTDLEKYFGSVDDFMTKFEESAMGRFGSGWTWLVRNKDGTMEIVSTANQDNPLSFGKTLILGIDVWEHAYYLKYFNKRADYVKAWWSVVNWDWVGERL